jgi:hypothetical protein
MGSCIYEHKFQPPTAHVDLGNIDQKDRWKEWISLALSQWLEQHLPAPFQFSALHHHPQASAQILGMSTQDNPQISAHQKLKAKEKLQTFL